MITVNFSRSQGARSALLGRTALCGVLTLGLAAGITGRPALAGPAGGTVVQGGATIQSAGTHTEITQTTQQALINWQNFSIGSSESVNFTQPNSRAVAVNRVTSQLPSDIQGQLTANGQVWIMNPNGIMISRNATVKVGGLVTTTARLSDEQFARGDYSFGDAPAGSKIVSAGNVTATDGSIVMVAPVVDVSGSLTAHGDVAVAAGSGFTVDFQGDGLTRFQVNSAEDAHLDVSGRISAQGGAAYLVG
jgi:filamentous hemagglutinin family protein